MDAITVKRNLTQELGSVIKAAVSERSDGEALPSDATQAVCNVIESIFIHGLRDPFFVKGSRYAKYPEPNFWPFISKFSHRSIRSQISGLKQIRSEVGRARAWVRIVLNEGVIEHYVTALSRDNKAVR
uniref:RUN domain-containing protein n=2 Tax=Plectus sambesii TaxID=2011161 RepID=A0A914VPX6_9BILA